jgi:ornithine cyclodeaminase/alanine dehydrogenase-like protein (mu-crystallin family)
MGYLPYVEGATLKDYIAAAGGYAEGAVESKTRIIKAQTKQWMEPDETTIQPGDEIYVPKEGDFSEDYSWRVAGSIAGIVSGVAFILFSIIDRLNKE